MNPTQAIEAAFGLAGVAVLLALWYDYRVWLRERQATKETEAVSRATYNIRKWLVQSWRYTASTFELDDFVSREIRRAIEEVRK